MATKDIIFSASNGNEFRVRLDWSSSSIKFLSFLKDDLKLIDDFTYVNLPRLKTPVYQIDDEVVIRQMASKLGLQVIPNFNVQIRNTKAS